MTIGWDRPVAVFRHDTDQPPVGAGVLVAGGFVLTCAHVIGEVLKGADPEVGGKTSVDFPFANVAALEAEIVAFHPAVEELMRGRCGPSDLAVLKLTEPDRARSIDPCLIAETDTGSNTAFTCQGYPRGWPMGARAEGVLRGMDGGGWIDAVADNNFGHFIEPGFSGAPVFEVHQGSVCAGTTLGLCVTADIGGGRRVARLIPPSHLAQVLRAVASPYRWLEYFDQRDAAYFFGREGLIEELWKDLIRQRFLVLAGPPGSGKSSLIRAGLMTVARRAGVNVLAIRPRGDARREFSRELGLPSDRAPSNEDIQRAVGVRLRNGSSLLLGIDQAEEMVQGLPADAASEFLQLLAELCDHYDELKIVLAVRSDALPLLLHAQPRRLVERNLRYIDQLGWDELRAAIERPPRRLRVTFESGLVGTIVNDALKEPRVPLPILQLCLSKLWELRADTVITSDAYSELGGLTGVLAQHANALLERIRPDSNTILKLVEVGTKGEDRRRRIPLSDFGASGAEMVRSLAAGRLILISHDPALGEDVAELAHDSLLTEWTTLQSWIAENRSFRIWHDRLSTWARDAPNNFLGEVALTEALARLHEDYERIDPVLRAFILRSRDAHQDRQRLEAERLRQERDSALRMQSCLLADRARQAARDGDPMTGILLALAALPDRSTGPERPWVEEASVALQEALAQNHERLCMAHSGPVWHAAFCSDGARIATVGEDKTAHVWDAVTGDELARCEGHGDRVVHVAFSPDGTRIATASHDNTARVWDTATGDEVARCKGHSDRVLHVAFRRDGARIVTASRDGTARVWDTATGDELRRYEGHSDRVYQATFSPDGRRIVTASEDSTSRVWEADTGSELAVCSHDSWVSSAAFSLDGAQIVTASQDKTARVWDARTGRQLALCSGHTDWVLHAAFSSDGAHIVTTSQDKTARVWDARTGVQLAVCTGHNEWVLQAAFGPDNAWIATAGGDGTARVWDAATGSQIALCKGLGGRMRSVSVSSDDGRIVVAGDDATARVLDVRTSIQLAICSGHSNWISHAKFSWDGARILTASRDATARVWDAATGGQLTICAGHDEWVGDAAFSPDGARIATVSRDGTARVWDAATGHELARCESHTGRVWHVSYSPDGLSIVTAGEDNTARIWDAATGNQLAVCNGHDDWVLHVEFSRDGKHIVTASRDGTAGVWDVATGNQLARCIGHSDWVLSAAFSPRDARIVTASRDKTARIWDAVSGNQLTQFAAHRDAVSHVMFRSDGKVVVSAGRDKTAQIWDATTGSQLAVCSGHTDWVIFASFSPDGERVVTTSDDETARIWDAATGSQLALCGGHRASVRDADFSPDGGRVVTASHDKTARIYRVFRNQSGLIAFARSRVTRELTQGQRIANYLELSDAEHANPGARTLADLPG